MFGSVCSFDRWPQVPVHVVAGADDRLFPVDFQRRVARDRLGVEADILPGGHLIALSEPHTLARYLLGQTHPARTTPCRAASVRTAG